MRCDKLESVLTFYNAKPPITGYGKITVDLNGPQAGISLKKRDTENDLEAVL